MGESTRQLIVRNGNLDFRARFRSGTFKVVENPSLDALAEAGGERGRSFRGGTKPDAVATGPKPCCLEPGVEGPALVSIAWDGLRLLATRFFFPYFFCEGLRREGFFLSTVGVDCGFFIFDVDGVSGGVAGKTDRSMTGEPLVPELDLFSAAAAMPTKL